MSSRSLKHLSGERDFSKQTGLRSIIRIMVCIGVMLLTRAALCHEERATTEVQLPEIVVKGPQDIGLDGFQSASQGNVSALQIDERPLLRTGEILEVVPGLMVTQHSGTGKANQYFLRGFNLDHGTDFAGFIDDVSINLPTHAHGQGYLDLNFLIPELIEELAFQKGPYYPEVGDFSSAGSAHLKLYNRLPFDFVKITGGQDFYGRVLGAASPKFAGGTWLTAIEAVYYNGPWELSEDLKKLNGLVKYSGGDRDMGYAATFAGYYASWDATDQVPQRAVVNGSIGERGYIDPTDGGKSRRLSGNLQWWRNVNQQQSKVNAYLVYERLNLFSNFTFFLDDPVNGDQFEQVDRRFVAGVNVSHHFHAWDFGFLEKPMEHTVGLQVRHDAIPELGLHKTRARRRLSTVRDDDVQQTSVGMFYRSELQFLPWLRGNAGIRGDLFRFKVRSDNALNSGDEFAGTASPKAGLIFGPWKKTEVYLNYGLGFHSNDARGTTISIDSSSGAPAQRVNPLVRSQGAEIGLRSLFVPRLSSTLSYFVLKLDSELVFVGDAGNTDASRPSLRHGVEWAADYKPVYWLTLDANIAFSHAEFIQFSPVGSHIPGALERAVSGGARVELPYGTFVTARVRHLGSRPLEESGAVRSGATTLLNLQAGYENTWLLASVDVLNATNSRAHDIDYYYASRLPGESADGVNDVHFHPVEPFTVRGNVTLKF